MLKAWANEVLKNLRKSEFTSLIAVISVSWSLLSKSEKGFFTLRFVFRLLLNGLDIVAIALMGVLGGITASGLSGASLRIFGFELPSPTPENVTILVGLIAFLFILKGGLNILFERWNSVFLAEIEIKNAVKLARYLFSGPLERLRQRSRAEIQFLLGTGTSAAFSGVLGAASSLVLEGSLFLSVLVMFLVVDWVSATAILFYFAVVILLLQLTTSRRYIIIGRDIQQASVDGASSVLEMVDGFREISVLSKQGFFLQRYARARKLDAITGVKLEILKSLPRFIAETGLILGALGFVVWQLNRGSLGEALFALGVFLAGSFRMMSALLPLQHVWNNLRVKQNWVKAVHEILVNLRDHPEPLNSRLEFVESEFLNNSHMAKAKGGLDVRLENVSFAHSNQQEFKISGITIGFSRGSFVAIVGPSGAGKTTLVDLILGLHTSQSGSVLIEGKSPTDHVSSFPGEIAYVPQRPGLVHGSIAENIALGVPLSQIDKQQVKRCLETVQLGELVSTLSEGIFSDLGPHSDALSGGQIQRLGLARALYTNPRLIVLDEATSALDAGTEASISEAIRGLGGESTVIVIAHRLSTIQHADVVYVMDEGKILASGTFKEVRKKVPMIEEYVKLMSFDDD